MDAFQWTSFETQLLRDELLGDTERHAIACDIAFPICLDARATGEDPVIAIADAIQEWVAEDVWPRAHDGIAQAILERAYEQIEWEAFGRYFDRLTPPEGPGY